MCRVVTNTLNTPIEALERAFPLKVRRNRLRRGSGDGIERDLEVLEDCTASLITERRHSRQWVCSDADAGRRRLGCTAVAGDQRN